MISRFIVAASLALSIGSVVGAQPADAVREARVHFDRGLELFNEGRNDAALAEFTRAYQLAPAPAVLYNIARVHEALGHAVEATDAYGAYLEQSPSLDPGRRREAEAAMARQRARIAHLVVRTNVEGAIISVDGIDVATAPLPEPLRLAAGEHTVGARAVGHGTARRSVQLAGGDRQTLTLELDRMVRHGTLRIVSDLEGVEVELDGRVLGTTPLGATIPTQPGSHVVVGRRPGYRQWRSTVELEPDAERVVELEMEADEGAPSSVVGQLRLRLPDAPAVVRIDGEPRLLSSGGLTLPSGPHTLELEVAEREPYSADIDIEAGSATELTPQLLWTPDARAERVASATTTRTWGQVITIAGAAILGGGVGVMAWNEARISKTDARLIEVNRMIAAMGCDGIATERCDELDAEGRALSDDQSGEQTARWVAWGVVGLGAVLTTVGLVLWIRAPSEASIDRDAHAAASLRLRAGLGELQLEGTF